jgi:hypothetical protein
MHSNRHIGTPISNMLRFLRAAFLAQSAATRAMERRFKIRRAG